MRMLIPLYKVPRIAAVFALIKRTSLYRCPSCHVRQRHWLGYVGGDAMHTPFVYVCLRCGQVSRSDKEGIDPASTIRVAVRTPAEAKAVRACLHNRKEIWGGPEIVNADGSIHLQWGSWDRAACDDLTTALRAAGFSATWEEEPNNGMAIIERPM